MQTCSRCSKQSPDNAQYCTNCQADLHEYSFTAISLKNLRNNPRVKMIRISVAADACPACLSVAGVYEKDQVPTLPVEGCSHAVGCRCFYDPILDEIIP